MMNIISSSLVGRCVTRHQQHVVYDVPSITSFAMMTLVDTVTTANHPSGCVRARPGKEGAGLVRYMSSGESLLGGGNGGSSGVIPPKRTYRLKRPPTRLQRPDMVSSTIQTFGPPPDPRMRPNVVTLFPGDYQDLDDDEDDGASNWEDDQDFDSPDDDDDDDEYQAMETERLLRELKLKNEELQRRRAKWLENAKPPIRESYIDERGRAYGRGGRKTASARVWIQAGFGEVTVNRRPFDEYFERMSDRELILQPLVVTETCGKFDLQCIVEGGGLTGQAGAIRHGLANALNAYNPDLFRPPLKKLEFLTRDARKVERKKIGHKKARKSPQWVRR